MVELNKPVQESEEGGGGGEESATTVSVLSYNLLAQDLIRKNRYLYSNAVPELLEWDFRKTNLLKDLTESDADVRFSMCIPVFLPCIKYHALARIGWLMGYHLTFCTSYEVCIYTNYVI